MGVCVCVAVTNIDAERGAIAGEAGADAPNGATEADGARVESVTMRQRCRSNEYAGLSKGALKSKTD